MKASFLGAIYDDELHGNSTVIYLSIYLSFYLYLYLLQGLLPVVLSDGHERSRPSDRGQPEDLPQGRERQQAGL